MKQPTRAEIQVKIKHPTAICIEGGRPRFQIWCMVLSFAGDKLGEGNTEQVAWMRALLKVRSTT